MTLQLHPQNADHRLKSVTVILLQLSLLQLLEVVNGTPVIGFDESAYLQTATFDDLYHEGTFRRRTIQNTAALEAANLEDIHILLAIKREFKNGEAVLTDWKYSSAAASCNWTAVTCGGVQGDRVIALSLGQLNLQGPLPPSVCKLRFLQHLNLSYNELSGSIPSSLGNCTHLVYVNLAVNKLVGEIPYFGDPSTTFRELQTLNFGNNSLTGPIPEWFGEYSSLSRIGLHINKLTGGIPSKFAQLSNLTILYLSLNKLSGPVNPVIGQCSNLISLALDMNDFNGPIPSELGELRNLEKLYLGTNEFTGHVPVAILTNCTKLTLLLFENNRLTGEIPPEVGRLQELQILYLRGNQLTGKIPVSFSNCSSLSWLSLDDNKLEGDLPWEFGQIQTLGSLNMWDNDLSNILPASLGNCTSLWRLTFGRESGILSSGQSVTPQPFPPWMASLVNMSYLELMTVGLYGPIPDFVFNFTQLVHLYLPYNNLSGPIPDAIENLTQLQDLDLTGNNLTGPIPIAIGSLSNLGLLSLGQNHLQGPFPSAVRNLKLLSEIVLDSNELSGAIPTELSFWSNLSFTKVSLRDNKFNGTIVSAFRNQFLLESLDVAHNELTGPIPWALGATSPLLKELDLSNNHLNGTIPVDLFTFCPQLIRVELQNNDLNGTISDSVGNLRSLQFLDLSNNQFSENLPTFQNMTTLSYLNLSWNQISGNLILDLPGTNLVTADLSHNNLSGPLPPELSSLIELQYLDLSVNSFSGKIPEALGKLQSLTHFNVSFNELEGPIPTTGVFAVMNLTGAFLGNTELCGEAVDRNCTSESASGSEGCKGFECKSIVIGVISGGSALLLLLVVSLLLWGFCYKRRLAPNIVDAAIRLNFPESNKVYKLSAEDLRRATDDFGPAYLIGEGAGTKVYKFVLPGSDQIYAAKVLHSGPSSDKYEKLLLEEVQALSMLRHRNVLRVVGFCCNEEIKAAILDYMPSGSLHSQLYSQPARENLSWDIRLNIAVGIAQGLVYIHTEFPEPIIHRDLKPMNILLDVNLEPKICDLGLGKYVYHHENGEASATALCGTIGYIAPEYTTSTRVSTKGDVYAYGIIILELLTRRQPTEKSFGEAHDIVSWAQTSASVAEILDPSLVPDKPESDEIPHIQAEQQNLFLRVALLCCQLSPQSRPTMRDVLGMLLQIKETKQENTD